MTSALMSFSLRKVPLGTLQHRCGCNLDVFGDITTGSHQLTARKMYRTCLEQSRRPQCGLSVREMKNDQ
jgi:hypothetical protein